LRAVLGQDGRVGLAEHDRRGLADAAGDGQELQRRLGDLTGRRIDQNENFSHGQAPTHTNFLDARNSTSLMPPSPSSVTISPAVRGGRGVVDRTLVQALSRPTSPASMPRSARLHCSTGFFLAAMMPLNDG